MAKPSRSATQAARLERRRAALERRASMSPAGPAPGYLRVATWNLNSLRARLEAVGRFLERAAPDVVCLQETKTALDVIAAASEPDPAVVGQWIAEVQAERLIVERALDEATPSDNQLTKDEVRALVEALGDIVTAVKDADPAAKADTYLGTRTIPRSEALQLVG